MNRLRYEIYSGAGNDFIIINNSEINLSDELQKRFTEKICMEKFTEIDGVIFVEKSRDDRELIKMKYYNRDGSYGAMCGNGARCTAMFVFLHKITSNKSFTIEALNRLYKAELKDEGNVKIFFPEPEEIKLDIDITVDFGGLKKLNVDYVNVGSDHVIVFLDDESNQDVLGGKDLYKLDINFYGRIIRFNSEFEPRGCNVNFVIPTGRSDLRIRTYERGVERETLACGTGVISSAIASVFRNKVQLPVKTKVRSGEILEVDFIFSHSRIMELSLTGSAKKISEGMIEL